MSQTEAKTHKARIRHRCLWCWQFIEVGETYTRYLDGMVKFRELARQLERDLAAAQEELASVKAENSKLRSALEIVHFKREPWQ